jgi:predicted AlkP superfamily phosphohydrolase/phosphomutase
MKRRLIIVGLDGATFDVIDPLLEQGQLPCLAKLISEGTRAGLLSTIPYATIPAWPSFMTGKNPGRHGVFDFFTIEEGKRRLVSSRDMRSPTLWQLLSDQDKRSVVMNVPATYPPTHINGVLVTGMLTPADSPFASPPEVTSLLHEVAGGYRINCQSHLFGEQLLNDVFDVTEKQKRAFLTLLRRDDWDFAMLMLRATDVIQHHFWEEQDVVQACYRMVDGCVSEIVDAFPHDTIFLVSDHGLQGQRWDFHINKWLLDKKYMYIRKGRTAELTRWGQIAGLEGREQLAQARLRPSNTSRALLKLGLTGHNFRKLVPQSWWSTLKRSVPRSIKDHIPAGNDLEYEVDWSRSLASAYQLYATESKAIQTFNLDHDTRERVCTELVAGLERLRNPVTNTPVVRRAYRREELYQGPFLHHAPDITLDLHDGYNVTNAFFASEYFTPRDEVRGCHHRMGIFVACGEDVQKGNDLDSPLSLLDVMPTALHYLDSAVPEDCDGRVLTTQVFDPHAEPCRREVRYESLESSGVAGEGPEPHAREQQAEIEDRLRALGYL